jgi:hypothetical protein
MKKIYLIFIITLFSFGCINFNYEPSIDISINGEENEIIIEKEPEPEPKIVEKNIYEIFNERISYCVLDEEYEKIEIKFEEEKIEIKFNKSDFFVNTKAIICLEEECIIYLNDFSKELDYDFLKTFSIIYEDYVFECIK